MSALISREDWPLGVECAWPAVVAKAAKTAKTIPPLRESAHWSARWPVRWPARLLRLTAALALGAGLWQIGQGGYIQAKAWLSQALIGQAWARTLGGERHVKPWPWADTWPVARISVPDQGIERFVLAGANGRAIAFGPGHVFGTPLPGEDGNSVIGAHRDTHFAFLRALQPGAEIMVEKHDGGTRRYRVSGAEIVDKSEIRVLAQPSGETRLTLITCYPFDALRAGGPLRYVVTADAI
ncbi:MAG: class GN sortase [Zoogloeaceae bacterium]|jgi:sortase A|nr:class GN sortase [Zoogloeaceae bacterium]